MHIKKLYFQKAVKFLNEDGKLRHNNLSAAAVYVTEAGVWKLGDLGYVTELNAPYPTKYSHAFKYDPPEILKSRSGSKSSPWLVDKRMSSRNRNTWIEIQ